MFCFRKHISIKHLWRSKLFLINNTCGTILMQVKRYMLAFMIANTGFAVHRRLTTSYTFANTLLEGSKLDQNTKFGIMTSNQMIPFYYQTKVFRISLNISKCVSPSKNSNLRPKKTRIFPTRGQQCAFEYCRFKMTVMFLRGNWRKPKPGEKYATAFSGLMVVYSVKVWRGHVQQTLQWHNNWARWRLKSPALRLFTQSFIQAQIKENIKAPRHWLLCREFTGDRWIPHTKGQ